MNDLSEDPETCPDIDCTQRAVIACSGNGFVFLSATCGIIFDIDVAGINAEDVLPRQNGLWVWEGKIISYNEDIEYVGKYRTLLKSELEAVAKGEDIFRCPKCNGRGHMSSVS